MELLCALMISVISWPKIPTALRESYHLGILIKSDMFNIILLSLIISLFSLVSDLLTDCL